MEPSGNPHPLRRPWDRSVADCMWVARFIDKARLHLTHNLSGEFEPFFGHRLATDGAFLDHFNLPLAETLHALRNDPADTAFATWFLDQPGVSPSAIAAWNELGPNLGKAGQVMERAFRYAQRKYYGGKQADPRVVSVFTGIAWDEGYIDEYPFA